MDVGSINNNINTELSHLSQQKNAPKVTSTQKTNNEDEFLKLSVASYSFKRDELSSSIQSFNEGIATSKKAIEGLEKQQDSLKKIEDSLLATSNNEDLKDKNSAKNQVNQELLNFKNIAFETKYKRESLLAQDMYESKEISVNTMEGNFSVDKPNTPEIASALSTQISQSDFNNPQSLEETIKVVKQTEEKIESIKEEFTTLEQTLTQTAKESIQNQITVSNQNKVNENINFGKEMSDFSKTNIQANLGHLVASQANIVQEQSVRLLS